MASLRNAKLNRRKFSSKMASQWNAFARGLLVIKWLSLIPKQSFKTIFQLSVVNIIQVILSLKKAHLKKTFLVSILLNGFLLRAKPFEEHLESDLNKWLPESIINGFLSSTAVTRLKKALLWLLWNDFQSKIEHSRKAFFINYSQMASEIQACVSFFPSFLPSFFFCFLSPSFSFFLSSLPFPFISLFLFLSFTFFFTISRRHDQQNNPPSYHRHPIVTARRKLKRRDDNKVLP